MRNCEEKEERLMLLESWRDFEKEFGSDSTMERVHKLLPEKVKKRRKLTAEDGVRTLFFSGFRNNLVKHPATDGNCSLFHLFFQSDAGWEEYYDYIFPEDAANQPNLKLLAMAKMWKRQQIKENDDEVLEKTPAAEETMEASSDEPTAPSENDRNTANDKEQETYDDRDDDDGSSSSSSESDSRSRDEDEEKPEKQGCDEEEG